MDIKYIKSDLAIEKIIDVLTWFDGDEEDGIRACKAIRDYVEKLPAADVVKVVRCKDCKHFEYDHPYIIQGIPVLGHEVCNAWGDGCKTDENGYCFMAERRTDEQIH